MIDKSFIDLFEEQVLKSPGNIAVICDQQRFSYTQLNERANQLANHLQSAGVKDETLVPLFIERGVDMIVGMIGIMKAGGAYVPVDMDFPEDRINYILRDTAANVVVCSKESRHKLPAANNISAIGIEEISNQPKENLSVTVTPGRLAYVIYTSGSTGVPKGVMIEHRNIVDYFCGLKQKTGINDCESFGLVSTIATDLGNTVLFGSLLSGGTLHIFSKESVSNLEYLHEYFTKHKIDCLKIVPSHWKALSMHDALLLPRKLLIFGGEALPAGIIDDIRSSGSQCQVVNHYGPTETTIGKLLHVVQPDSEYDYTVPIGKPFSNSKVLVLTKNLKLCPIGVPGQLFITGDGLARGYLNNPGLTDEKFIPNPFSKDTHSVMYSTGDMVKYLPDGNITFIGRVDNQVKIRGYRIEPGEIESVLQQCDFVSQAVVLPNEDKQGSLRLVGYVIPKGQFEKERIFAVLKGKLPEYMVPALLVEMEAFPLTPNGKVDRKSFPDPEAGDQRAGEYVAPRNEVETRLAELWQDVLEVDQAGMNDDFFELGGHSLLAVRLVSAIRKAFVVEMPISDIFDYPTVALLATQLSNNADTAVTDSIEAANPRPEHIPLSFSQERLWFIDRLEGSIQYHVPAVLRLKGKLKVEALNFALKTIVDRHEILRSVILEDEGHPYQHVKESHGWELSVFDGSGFFENRKALQDYVTQLIRKPFDLANDDMFRASLITLAEEDYLLIATLHHIASDGWSRSILVKEVVELYNSFEENRSPQLTPLNVQYADYAIWQRNNLIGEAFDKKLLYWKQKLENVAPIQLPTDFKRPSVWSSRGAFVPFKIEKEIADRLTELSQKKGATPFMVLLAAFKVLLHRYSGQQDICVGTPIAGRQQIELEELIGFFVNTLAVRNTVHSDMTFAELLRDVRETTLQAYAHQEVPFERVVDALELERDVSRNPVFQAMFVLRNTPEVPELKLGDVTLSAENSEHTTAMFDIQVFVTETPNGLLIMTEYCTDLFSADTIKRMMVHFKELLSSIIENPVQKLSELRMLTKEDELRLLIDLNNTGTDYPKDKTVVHLFEEQVAQSGDDVAIFFEEVKFTYKELNSRANQLASFLRKRGIKQETLVAMCLERGPQMIVGIWGILKAGAAYVPIDPEYPSERIEYMLEDTKARVVITTPESRQKISNDEVEIIELDRDFSSIKNESPRNPEIAVEAHQLAYVIYTSGSTGKPKGVMNQHAGLANRLYWAQDYFKLTPRDVVLQKTTFCFDVSVWELLWPSLVGAKIVFAKPGGQKDNAYIKSVIEKYKISVLHFVPSMLGVFLPDLAAGDCPSLKKVLCSGEALTLAHVNLFKEKLPGVELHNLYGPTEAAIDVTCWSPDISEQLPDAISIGKPVANTSIYILDEHENLVPCGGLGEICIGGVQVARGYLNRPELTAQRFISNAFSKFDYASNGTHPKLYKTGDIGRWMLDGNIEYRGRKDNQVKIRGYRIELGEIEAALVEDRLIKEAAVLSKTDKDGGVKLVSYYVPRWEHVKSKERQLYMERVANWKELYDTEYARSNDLEIRDEFNLAGWNSSFTGEAIPAREMREWVEDIVKIILSGRPNNVLEIGCGTGLIYYPLAGKVKKYIGTDLSKTSISQIRERIKKGERDYGITELNVCAAHEVSLPPGAGIDTIILNSIVQYFPGEEYMLTVLDKCFSLLDKGGRIIIGDVRDYRLLELFKYRLQALKLQPSAKIRELKWTVEQEILKEEELCFSPEFFYDLKRIYPQITHIDIEWKNASYLNELSLYRYTVIIYAGIEKEIEEPQWVEWPKVQDKRMVINMLEAGQDVALKDVPNYRLGREQMIDNVLAGQSLQTVGDLLRFIEEDAGNLEILKIINTARDNGYNCRLFLDQDPLKVNILLQRNPNGNFIKQEYSERIDQKKPATNVPLFSSISSLLQKEIKSTLQVRLPDYMVPAELIALTRMPLTGSGKIDRNFLSTREDKAVTNKLNYVAPRNETEQILANIWQQLLNVERVGIQDNFFELGGHSLLAIRLLATIRKVLNVELSVNDIFIYPRISEFSEKFFQKEKDVPGDEAIPNLKHLVPVKTSGNKIPIYIIAGGGGTALRFMKFAQMLDEDQPVYVLQPPVEAKDLKDFPKTVEEISKKFIDEIMQTNPEGPYALSGHCAGGIFAFEMSKQLEQMGKKVQLLAMFDTIVRNRNKRPPASIRNLYHVPASIQRFFSKIMLKINFESFLLRKHTSHAINYKLNSLKRIIANLNQKKNNAAQDELQTAGLDIFNESLGLYQDACRKYNLEPYDKEILLFYAKEHYYFTDTEKKVFFKKLHLNDETKNMWKRYAASVKSYDVTGGHSTIFDPANGNEFARILQNHLDNRTKELRGVEPVFS